MKLKSGLLILILLMSVHSGDIQAAESRLTIIHTNDLHSHFLGFSPNRDYTPEVTGDDQTIGGWARIATVIQNVKNSRDNPVLVLDAGDFLMGSLFHMVSREEALELELMTEMGIEFTTLGNHEYDLEPDGLARILEAAIKKGKMPQIVASNVVFDDSRKEDDRLQELFRQGWVKPYRIVQKADLKIGLFGLMGDDAASVAPFASPVTFSDRIESAKKMVKILREKEKVDLIICLSHSGLNRDPDSSEDQQLAREVPDIDIIISGHTHTRLLHPILENGTVIVQAWEYGKQVGILDISADTGRIKVMNYKVRQIDDTIPGNRRITGMIENAKPIINEKVLRPYHLSFDQVLVETGFDLHIEEKESNLGNLITDATRWAVDQSEYTAGDPSSRVSISVQSNGVIRDDILKGKTGKVSVSDLFRTSPLGIGWDGSMSYPLVSMYVTAPEIKKAFEVLTSVYPLKGSDYYIQVSGARMVYNPYRMLFDRVTEIRLQDEKGNYRLLDTSSENPRLYKIVTNIYNATFLKVIGSFTSSILTIVPKDKSGMPIEDLGRYRVDADKTRPGIQEIKDWTALMSYVQTFEDTDGDGIPDIPERYRDPEGRQVVAASLNPYHLLAGGNYLTWIAFGILVLVLGVVWLILYIGVRIVRKRS